MLKSNFKKRIVIPALLIFFISLFTIPVSAYVDNGYKITAYNVNVKVNENNVLDFTETVSADFLLPSHGIFRTIPVIADANWVIDGKRVSKTYRVPVKNISVTDGETGQDINYQKSREGNDLVLKIGSEDEIITGAKTYIIKYSYAIGNDGMEQFDELYYNLIGNSWDTTIDNFTFKIDMPKEFDKSLLNFTVGKYGSTDTSGITYEVAGKTIEGNYSKTLKPGEGVTVRLELPNQYFTPDEPETGLWMIFLFIAFTILSIILFFIFGKDNKVYQTVEVSPPDDITSAEAGYIIDGHVDDRDIVSLIIYWADKGYLAIHSDKSDNFTLIKLKDADDSMRKYEKIMFNKLFKDRERVTSADLQYNFSETLFSVKMNIIHEYSDPSRRLYTNSGNVVKAICYIFAGLCMGIISGKAIGNYSVDITGGIIAGVIAFSTTIFLAGLIGYFVDKSHSGSIAGIVISSLIYAFLLIVAAMICSFLSGFTAPAYLAAIAAVICGITGAYSKKRTDQSSRMLGKLLGLKRFITLTEKSRIEMMIQENPSLFYNILPYAYVLGVTDKWAKQFESIALSPPSWYSNERGDIFSSIYFMSLLNHNLRMYQTNMVAVRPSNNSTQGGSVSSMGFGGGGFSGGGFGGGGGGRW